MMNKIQAQAEHQTANAIDAMADHDAISPQLRREAYNAAADLRHGIVSVSDVLPLIVKLNRILAFVS